MRRKAVLTLRLLFMVLLTICGCKARQVVNTELNYIGDVIAQEVSKLKKEGVDSIITIRRDCNGCSGRPFKLSYVLWKRNNVYYVKTLSAIFKPVMMKLNEDPFKYWSSNNFLQSREILENDTPLSLHYHFVRIKIEAGDRLYEREINNFQLTPNNLNTKTIGNYLYINSVLFLAQNEEII